MTLENKTGVARRFRSSALLAAFMGMFDDIKCKYPLPVDGANGLDYQTKDTPEQQLDRYEIREDGTLWHEAYDPRFEETSEAPLGFYIHRDNKRWEAVSLTGEVRFYTTLPPKHSGWIEWSAYFVSGKLNQLHLLEHRAPDAANTKLTGREQPPATQPKQQTEPAAPGPV